MTAAELRLAAAAGQRAFVDVTVPEGDLSGVDLASADLSGARLRGLRLERAVLAGARLVEADLRGADLRDAALVRADLRGADLRDADLRGADLAGVDLRGADLRGADVRGARLEAAAWPMVCKSFERLHLAGATARQLLALLRTARIDDPAVADALEALAARLDLRPLDDTGTEEGAP